MSASRADPRGWDVTRGVMLAAAAATVVSGVVGFVVGQVHATGRVTHLAIAPCGLDAAPAPVALPLADLMRKSNGHGLSLGPFSHDGLDRAVTVRFAQGDTEPYRVSGMEGHDLLVLPLPASSRALPHEIRLECRYGTVARVQYRIGQTRQAFDIDPAPATVADG